MHSYPESEADVCEHPCAGWDCVVCVQALLRLAGTPNCDWKVGHWQVRLVEVCLVKAVQLTQPQWSLAAALEDCQQPSPLPYTFDHQLD